MALILKPLITPAHGPGASRQLSLETSDPTQWTMSPNCQFPTQSQPCPCLAMDSVDSDPTYRKTSQPDLEPISSHWSCSVITGLCLTMITLTSYDHNPDTAPCLMIGTLSMSCSPAWDGRMGPGCWASCLTALSCSSAPSLLTLGTALFLALVKSTNVLSSVPIISICWQELSSRPQGFQQHSATQQPFQFFLSENTILLNSDFNITQTEKKVLCPQQ